VIVVLEKAVYVYDIKTLKQIQKIATVDNERGVAAVNSEKTRAIFACPTDKLGEIQLINFDRDTRVVIPAHKTMVTALALNSDGTLVASASAEGQVIRVFKTEDGKLVQELRRGNDTCTIQCINFDPVTKWLSCTSEKGTIHVFAINKEYHLESKKNTAEVREEQKQQNMDHDVTTVGHPDAKKQKELVCTNPKSMFSFLKPFRPSYFVGEYSFA